MLYLYLLKRKRLKNFIVYMYRFQQWRIVYIESKVTSANLNNVLELCGNAANHKSCAWIIESGR